MMSVERLVESQGWEGVFILIGRKDPRVAAPITTPRTAAYGTLCCKRYKVIHMYTEYVINRMYGSMLVDLCVSNEATCMLWKN